MTTPEQRAHWRALEQAAMPDWQNDEERCNITGMSKSGARFPMGFSYCQTFTDFTLAARTAVPALLDHVEALEAAQGHVAKLACDRLERILKLERELADLQGHLAWTEARLSR